MNLANAFGRLLTIGAQQTDTLPLAANADNVFAHDLGRPIVEAVVTLVGDPPAEGFGWSLKDPATLDPPQSADHVVCFRVTVDAVARIRVRPAGLLDGSGSGLCVR